MDINYFNILSSIAKNSNFHVLGTNGNELMSTYQLKYGNCRCDDTKPCQCTFLAQIDLNGNLSIKKGRMSVMMGNLVYDRAHVAKCLQIYLGKYNENANATLSNVNGMGPVSFDTDIPVALSVRPVMSFAEYVQYVKDKQTRIDDI